MNNFELWPAIDIINGKPVRLKHGDFAQKNEYEISIEKIIDDFNKFANGIHVVDLDGAKTGKPQNLTALEKILNLAGVPVEFGGGLRDDDSISQIFNLGVSQVIIGTQAVEDTNFLKTLLKKFGKEKVAISIDINNSKVLTRGWLQETEYLINDFLKNISEIGIQKFIITDIKYDGTLSGPPISLYNKLVQEFPILKIIASGGVAKIDDLNSLKKTNVQGAVFGKAYYEKTITPTELIEFSKNA